MYLYLWTQLGAFIYLFSYFSGFNSPNINLLDYSINCAR